MRTIPALPVVDVRTASRFYEDRLGFKAGHVSDDFAIATRDEVEIHL